MRQKIVGVYSLGYESVQLVAREADGRLVIFVMNFATSFIAFLRIQSASSPQRKGGRDDH